MDLTIHNQAGKDCACLYVYLGRLLGRLTIVTNINVNNIGSALLNKDKEHVVPSNVPKQGE